MSADRIEFSHSFYASQGRRARQEDYCAVWQAPDAQVSGEAPPLLVVLADGMGGHVSGDFASKLACTQYIEVFTSGGAEIGPKMARALDECNGALGQAIGNNSEYEGMGCTLVGAYFDHSGLRWVSVGDSALLLYRNGSLRRLNADHSHGAILDKQVAEGIISQEAALTDSRRRALHSALTGERIPMQDLELSGLPLLAGDVLIVASDGLLTLEGDEIARELHNMIGAPAEDVARHLVETVDARDKPRQDNTTVVVVKINKDAGSGSAADNGSNDSGVRSELEPTLIRPTQAPAQTRSSTFGRFLAGSLVLLLVVVATYLGNSLTYPGD
ncbi:MAG: protein phosphatase 2C domain-containing protein [Alphaproteobacteria bacterium]|nr:protein phosphatase 2C domain-containing protein [Alphaproteobacteria bacterium]